MAFRSLLPVFILLVLGCSCSLFLSVAAFQQKSTDGAGVTVQNNLGIDWKSCGKCLSRHLLCPEVSSERLCHLYMYVHSMLPARILERPWGV